MAGAPEDAWVDTVVQLTSRRTSHVDTEIAGLVIALMRAAGRHRAMFESRAHDEGGKHLRAFSVLYMLWIFEHLQARDLTRLLGISRQTISAALASLESAGMILRARGSTGDRRLVEIRLTPAGRASVEREFHAQHHLDGRWFEALSVHDRRTLRSLLERLVAPTGQHHPMVG
ncbi:MAG: MarR family transcriptional regulator [Actinomycetales bacterium]|nr:MarR family transcriptional regulator [Actinomycetales bacterium]